MEGTLAILDSKKEAENSAIRSSECPCKRKCFAASDDAAVLVSVRERIFILDIERALIDIQKDSIRTRMSDANNGSIDIVSSISIEGSKVPMIILLSAFLSKRINQYEASHELISFPTSAYVIYQRSPVLSDPHSGTSI